MYLDRQNTVSQAQAVTVTAVSTDTIDLGVARDVGAGEDMRFVVDVDQAFATATSVEIQVIISAAANLSSPTVLASSGALPIAQLTAGRRPIEVPVARSNLLALPLGQRFIGLNYVVAGSAATAGQLTSSLISTGFQDVNKNYPVGYAIL